MVALLSFFSFGGLSSIGLIIFSIKKLFTEEQDMLTHAKPCQIVSFRTSEDLQNFKEYDPLQQQRQRRLISQP